MKKFEDLILSLDQECISVSTKGQEFIGELEAGMGTPEPLLGNVYFGHPPKSSSRQPLSRIPPEAKRFSFLLDSQSELLRAYANSSFPERTEAIQVGSSGQWGNSRTLDYSESVALLSNVKFPNLKILDLGVVVTDDNFNYSYGTVGDIGRLINHCPELEELRVWGHWTLEIPLPLSKIKYFEIDVPHSGDYPQVDPVSQNSFSNLLSSEMPRNPTFFAIHLHQPRDFPARDPIWYEVPDSLLNWTPTRPIEIFGLSGGFVSGTKARFERSPLAGRIRQEYLNVTLSDNLVEPTDWRSN